MVIHARHHYTPWYTIDNAFSDSEGDVRGADHRQSAERYVHYALRVTDFASSAAPVWDERL